MSEAVVGYQLLILASVIGVGVLIGPRSMVCTAIAWVVWTIAMVFTRWLFLFQFATIALAFVLGLAIQESRRFTNAQRLGRKAMLWLCFAGVLLTGVALYFETVGKQDFQHQTYSAPSAQPTDPTPAAQEKIDDRSDSSYHEALILIEAKYPALNPDHPSFRQDLIDWIASRMADYKSRGNSPTKALLLAIEDMERAALTVTAVPQTTFKAAPGTNKSAKATPTTRQPERACEFKGVMSDDDYRACGLAPPGRTPNDGAQATAPPGTDIARPAAPSGPYVFDKGGHPGFPPNCRWLSRYEWSCS